MSDLLIDDVAQKLYISSMLGNPALFARVQHLLKPSYFDAGLQDAIEFMKSFYREHRGVPSIPVFHAGTKLSMEATVLPKQDVEFVAGELAKFCQIRAVTEAVLSAPALIEKGDFGRMVEDIKLATQVQLHSDLGIEYFANPMARLEESESAEVLIPTGWDSVDELIGGGVGRQELVLFTANSGGGKSVAMLNMGWNLLRRGLNGVYITLEMRDRVVAKRLDSMISRIAGKNINANKLKVGEQIEVAKEDGYGRFFIKRMREGSTTADHVISYLRELEAVHGFKPDFVIVDYIDLMASVTKHSGDNMFTKDKYVTEEVRAIGFDFDCLMISASQLGRGAIVATREDKALGQDHIQGGISKINTSDLVIALVKDEAMDAAGEYRFEFLKARNSNAVNKKLTMRWEFESLRISDMGLTMATKTSRPGLRPPGVVPGRKNDALEALMNAGPAGPVK
jgi:KaiC/GvpD/RAD55 family RecA-like ATPase